MTAERQMRKIREEAGSWLVQLSSDEATSEDWSGFMSWLRSDPRHEAVYRDQERIWQDIPQLAELAEEFPLDRTGPVRLPGRANPGGLRQRVGALPGYLWPVAAAASLAFLAMFVLRPDSGVAPPEKSVHATRTAQIDTIELEDGSVVTLGARSAMDIEFDGTLRRVVLTEGEAFFSVAKDRGRPFVVEAGDAIIRVVGTKFEVDRSTHEVRIAVQEGVVEVSARDEPAKMSASGAEARKHVLTAGQRAAISGVGEFRGVVELASAAPPALWRSGRLSYEDASLREIVADANRYYDGTIVIASENLAGLRITAAFKTDQIEQMVETLTRALPIEARRSRDGRIVLQASDKDG